MHTETTGNDKALLQRRIFASAAFAFVGCTLVEAYRAMPAVMGGEMIVPAMLSLLCSWTGALKAIACLALLFAVGMVAFRDTKRAGEALYRYRYVIALVLFVLAVTFKLSGTSIAAWAASMPPASGGNGVLAGVPRECRTDEYTLFTAMTVAQFHDPAGFLPYFGSVLRGTTTDMYFLYGQPVADIAIVFRPFQWGYLFLGLERGLSFYWYGRLIALFMASFEFGMTVLRRRRALSVAYAALVAGAPVVSWWFSINGLVEMLVFGQAGVVLLAKYATSDSRRTRTLIACVLVVFAGGFGLAVYPAWEIPLAYVFILIALVAGLKRRRSVSLGAADIATGLAALAVLAAGMAYIIVKSHGIIEAESGTAYPGQRIDTGGGAGTLAFHYPLSFMLPFVPSGEESHLIEGRPDTYAMFFSLFPLGLVLAFVHLVRALHVKRPPDALATCLVALAVLFGAYCFIGLPEWLARITLLSKTTTPRLLVIFSFVNLLLLFRMLAVLKPPKPNRPKRTTIARALGIAIPLTIMVMASCAHFEQGLVDAGTIVAIGIALAAFMFAALIENKTAFVAMSIVAALICGGFVNPVQVGLSVVEDNPLITSMAKVKQQDSHAVWAAAVSWKSNLGLLAGAPTLNSTNIYPNPELWAYLDPTDERENEWNRYLHIHLTVSASPASFGLSSQDTMDMNLTPADLKNLGVSYLLSETDLAGVETDGVGLEELEEVGSYRIYHVSD